MKSIDNFFHSRPLQGAIGSLDEFFGRSKAFGIPIDLYETNTELVIKAEIPGVKREQIQLDIEGHYLRISVEHKEENEVTHRNHNFYRRERSYQHSERSIQLPYAISEKHCKATYQNGILTITAPRGTKVKKRIQIDEA
ncbi:Hsp20/alpha crystallin family protein [Bacillus sp. RD4P76]|uniref:Hsp20/alpha crystallin family protein n=2 Tax=Bacillus suaedaesalsae TaxID=2810349 RepID=A0ABS2DED2_9BACI|nr:Hsp20/alpha crystallin family protein [Bacillus suaedaesalsae]